MDQTHFDAVARSLTGFSSRRDVLRGLDGTGLGLGGLRLADTAEAMWRKNKKKQKRPKAVVNQYDCLDVGQPCQGDSIFYPAMLATQVAVTPAA